MKTFRHTFLSNLSVVCCVLTFLATGMPAPGLAQTVPNLPAPGTRLTTSADFVPALLKGVKIHPDNPLRLDFILDTGQAKWTGPAVTAEANRLIKYFLASLTVPEVDLWVNLSPYEAGRIIPDPFAVTDMGRDLLAQDYVLKQLTASLLYPEEELGQRFWDQVYQQAGARYGTSEIPVNSLHKVWIVPDAATVYVSGDVAYVTESHLKVMMEDDYLASQRAGEGELSDAAAASPANPPGPTGDVPPGIVRDLILPEIEREVNEGTHFANLRQIYTAMILATWFKRHLRQSLLGEVYVGQNKVRGIDDADPSSKDAIYQQYLTAFQQGVYNYIREDYDPATRQTIPRKYFSGGALARIDPRNIEEKIVSSPVLERTIESDTDGDALQVPIYLDPLRRVDGKADQISSPVNNVSGETGSFSHWDPSWPDPLIQEMKTAKELLAYWDKENRESANYATNGSQFAVSSRSGGSMVARARTVRTLFYLTPDIAGALLVSIEFGSHSDWQNILNPILPDDPPPPIETEVLGKILDRGLDLFSRKESPSLNGQSLRIRRKFWDLQGISGLLGHLTEEQGLGVIQAVHTDRLPILVEGMVDYLLHGRGEEVRENIRNLLQQIPPARMQQIQSKLTLAVKNELQSIYSQPLPDLSPLPMVEKAVARIPGKRIGPLVILREQEPSSETLRAVPPGSIVAMTSLQPTRDTRFGPFGGLLTFAEEGETSHAQARARRWRVPHALWPGPESLAELEGQEVVLDVGPDGVSLRLAEASDRQGIPGPAPSQGAIDLPSPNLTGEEYYLAADNPLLQRPEEVGYKVALLNQLATRPIAVTDPTIQVKVVTGTAFPFRTFFQALDSAYLLTEVEYLIGLLGHASEKYNNGVLVDIRQRVAGLSRAAFDTHYQQFVGHTDYQRLLKNGVFVRSSTLAENSPQDPDLGSGIGKTVAHVKGKDAFWAAVTDVWASAWSPAAYWGRHNAGLSEDKGYPAVWLVPSLAADYSFVLHTTSTRNANQSVIDLMPGLGESVVSDVGFPTHVVWDKTAQDIVEQEAATKESFWTLAPEGGTKVEQMIPQIEFLNHPDALRLIQALSEVGAQAEAFFGQPQEIEGALSYDPQNDSWTISLLQTRFLQPKITSSPVQQDRLILAIALFGHGGPFNVVNQLVGMNEDLDYISEKLPDIQKPALEIREQIAEIEDQYRNEIVPTAKRLESEADDSAALAALQQDYRQWLQKFKDLQDDILKLLTGLTSGRQIVTEAIVDARTAAHRNILNAEALLELLEERQGESVSLNEVLTGDDVLWKAKGRAVFPVEVSLADNLPRVRGKRALLHVAPERIIENAFKAINDRQKDLAAADQRVMVTGVRHETTAGTFARMVISNPGRITDEQLLQIDAATGLQKIFSYNPNRSDFYKSLGLPFAAAAIKTMGGRIEVRNLNRPVDGLEMVEFTIDLPEANDAEHVVRADNVINFPSQTVENPSLQKMGSDLQIIRNDFMSRIEQARHPMDLYWIFLQLSLLETERTTFNDQAIFRDAVKEIRQLWEKTVLEFESRARDYRDEEEWQPFLIEHNEMAAVLRPTAGAKLTRTPIQKIKERKKRMALLDEKSVKSTLRHLSMIFQKVDEEKLIELAQAETSADFYQLIKDSQLFQKTTSDPFFANVINLHERILGAEIQEDVLWFLKPLVEKFLAIKRLTKGQVVHCRRGQILYRGVILDPFDNNQSMTLITIPPPGGFVGSSNTSNYEIIQIGSSEIVSADFDIEPEPVQEGFDVNIGEMLRMDVSRWLKKARTYPDLRPDILGKKVVLTVVDSGMGGFLMIAHAPIWKDKGDSAIDHYGFSANRYTIEKAVTEGTVEKIAAVSSPAKDSVGGIDLNPNSLDLRTQGEGVDFNAPFDPQAILSSPIDGFAPVIIQIVPLNLPLLLGQNPAPDTPRLSQAGPL